MRHVYSVVLSLILAPLIYVAAGYSAVKLGEATVTTSIDWRAALLGLAAGLVAGGLYAVLVMARLSPFGPVLAGLAFLGVSVWFVLDPEGFVDVLPAKFLGVPGVLWAPVGAGTLLLCVPLLMTIFSPRRWRSIATPDGAAPVYSDAAVSAAPTYPDGTASAAPRYDTVETETNTPS